MTLTLRPLDPATDGDRVFAWMCDPEGVRMAAFNARDPDDRAGFDAYLLRNVTNPDNRNLAIELDGELVGSIAAFTMEGDREVTYWIDRAHWGRGIASEALVAFLELEPVRPLWGRAAVTNAGSITVLERAGFREVGRDRGFASGVGAEVEEVVLRLD